MFYTASSAGPGALAVGAGIRGSELGWISPSSQPRCIPSSLDLALRWLK